MSKNIVLDLLRCVNYHTAQYVADLDCTIHPGDQYVTYMIWWSVFSDSSMSLASKKQLKRCIHNLHGIVAKLSAAQKKTDTYAADRLKIEIVGFLDLIDLLSRATDTIQWNGVLSFLHPVWPYVSQYPETYDLINTILDFADLHASPRAIAEAIDAVAAVSATWPT